MSNKNYLFISNDIKIGAIAVPSFSADSWHDVKFSFYIHIIHMLRIFNSKVCILRCIFERMYMLRLVPACRLIVGSWAIAVSGQLRQGSKQFALSVGGKGRGRERGHAKKEETPAAPRDRARCAVTGAHHPGERGDIPLCILSQCACHGVMRARPRVDRREALRVNWIRVTRREKLRRNDATASETAVKQRNVSKRMQPDMRADIVAAIRRCWCAAYLRFLLRICRFCQF